MPTRKKSRSKKRAPAKRSRKRAKRRATGQAAGQATNSRTHTDYNRNHVEIQVGTAQQNIARARRMLENDLAQLFLKKRKTKTKRERDKIAKKMRDLSQRINRLN